MKSDMDACIEALSVARGDGRDAPAVRAHLAACRPCALQVTQVRAIVSLARTSLDLETDAALQRFPRITLRPSRRPVSPLQGFALAASAASLLVGLTGALALREGPAAPATTAASIETFRVHGIPAAEPELFPASWRGAERRANVITLSPQYVLETIPANAVVVDTF